MRRVGAQSLNPASAAGALSARHQPGGGSWSTQSVHARDVSIHDVKPASPALAGRHHDQRRLADAAAGADAVRRRRRRCRETIRIVDMDPAGVKPPDPAAGPGAESPRRRLPSHGGRDAAQVDTPPWPQQVVVDQTSTLPADPVGRRRPATHCPRSTAPARRCPACAWNTAGAGAGLSARRRCATASKAR